MKIFIAGALGQLGQELVRQGCRGGSDMVSCDLPHVDITRADQVEKAVDEAAPDLVVNAAAYTQVDRAETEPELAFRVNRDGPGYLAEACRRRNVPMIHISTDYVFAGDKTEPYRETDPVCPLGVYGRSKAAGEERVRSILTPHIIIRTSWLYGVYGHNFVKTMLRLGRERPVIRVVSDQYGCPTSAADLAEAVLAVATRLKGDCWGTYHFCNQGVISWHQFAKQIFEFAEPYGYAPLPGVEPIGTEDYPTAARRPMFSALNCDRIRHRFTITQKPWAESLKGIVERIFGAAE